MKIPTEHMEQVTFVNWFELSYPEYADWLFAIPNGAHLAGNMVSRAKQMNKLKSEGLKAGVPDLFLPVMLGGYGGLFIEMKRQKDSRTSAGQKKWHQYLNSAGYKAVVCKGFGEAKEVIECYLADAMSTI